VHKLELLEGLLAVLETPEEIAKEHELEDKMIDRFSVICLSNLSKSINLEQKGVIDLLLATIRRKNAV